MGNKIKLMICGIKYTVTSDESEEYMQSLCSELEAKVKEFRAANPYTSPASAALMAALEYLDSFKKSQKQCEALSKQLKIKQNSENRSQMRLPFGDKKG